MPSAICMFMLRFALARLKPRPMSMSAFWFVVPDITGTAVLLCSSPWNCCRKAAPQLIANPVNGSPETLGA